MGKICSTSWEDEKCLKDIAAGKGVMKRTLRRYRRR
jgi:hypothetical protein